MVKIDDIILIVDERSTVYWQGQVLEYVVVGDIILIEGEYEWVEQ